jgi:hypothetical protein
MVIRKMLNPILKWKNLIVGITKAVSVRITKLELSARRSKIKIKWALKRLTLSI